MQFSKPAGLRLTDIRMESGFNVIELGRESIWTATRETQTRIFKIKPLFQNQTLKIKNCSIEIEFFERK